MAELAGIDTSEIRFTVSAREGPNGALMHYEASPRGGSIGYRDLFRDGGLDMQDYAMVRVHPNILTSDEEIVANMAHEAYELNKLHDRLQSGTMTVEEFRGMVDANLPRENWHDEAWGAAQEAVERYRQAVGTGGR